ncbi:hypothetical protein FOWG_17636 [Fusarium oxysporum f. sp. lycopersici MN25]|nr:hypothetical protein FOWG_17636 [Fusarium oxysporum f. sp. lycopersici MN25]
MATGLYQTCVSLSTLVIKVMRHSLLRQAVSTNYICILVDEKNEASYRWRESHMWRLGIPIIHYGNEVIDWTGASGQMKGEVTAYSQPTLTGSYGVLALKAFEPFLDWAPGRVG